MERWLVNVTNEKVTHWSWTIRVDLRPRRRTCRPSSASETGRRWGRGTCCRPRRLRRPAAPASRQLSGRCPQLVDTDFAEVGCSVGCKNVLLQFYFCYRILFLILWIKIYTWHWFAKLWLIQKEVSEQKSRKKSSDKFIPVANFNEGRRYW